MYLTEFNTAKYLRNVTKGSPDECWSWTGSILSNGYGQLNIGSEKLGWKTVKAHRVAYFLETSTDPGELLVCHKCDNRSCVNPSHLFLGTIQENMADKVAKQRQARGERQHLAKLNISDVIAIRELYEAGEGSHQTLATQFGVAENTVFNVVHRLTWKHV